MRKRPEVSTRERVLDVALDRFNDAGAERVTTRSIAEAACINEGNLYYYFRTKEALVLALFGRFEAQALDLLGGPLPEGDCDLAPYAALLRRWFLLTWSYRFLFRDLLFLQTAAPGLQTRLAGVMPQIKQATRAVFDAMQAAGLIVIPPDAREALLANLWIVSSYWLSYLVLHDGVQTVTPASLVWGLGQVRNLYAPYLTDAARQWLAQHPEPQSLSL